MRAVRFTGPGQAFEVADVPVPEPGPGEVLVRVAACGVCASDLHLRSGRFPTRAGGPVTPGHEPAGYVAGVGPGVDGWAEGDRVAVTFVPRRCGQCAPCLAGGTAGDCTVPLLLGMDLDGAWAEYVAVPAEALVRVPDGVPLDVAALLTDAVATPFNALVEVGGLRPGERVAVFGTGGIGVHAVQLARLAGASLVVAVDSRPAARKHALSYGADHVIDPAVDDPADSIHDLTDGRGVDVALECVGANDVLREAVACLGPRGRCVLVGVSDDDLALGPALAFSALRTSLRGAFIYQRHHYQAVLDLVEAGRLDLTRSISARLPLEEADRAVDMLASPDSDVIRILLQP